jgi:hypothetical protein
LSPPGNFGPPLPIPLTTLGGGGSEIPLFPKKPFSPNFSKPPFFVCLTPRLAKRILGNEDEILKTKRGFFSSRVEEQKPLPVFAKVPPVGRIEAVFQPHFSDFWFFLLQSRFCGSCFGEVEMKFEKQKEVFSPDKLIYNKILQFFHRCH